MVFAVEFALPVSPRSHSESFEDTFWVNMPVGPSG